MITNKFNKNKGFTLLFAVLVSVLILSVGISIINLSVKQVSLSGSGRESQYAFYAANTGIECVYFWDFNPPEDTTVFPVTQDDLNFRTPEVTNKDNNIKCAFAGRDGERDLYDSLQISNWDQAPETGLPDLSYSQFCDSGVCETEFWLAFDNDLPYCAHVKVKKEVKTAETTGDKYITTQIDSLGYNTCDKNSRRRVERGLRVNY
jgi:hypothetical protein